MSVQSQMTQIKRLVDSLESFSSESMSLCSKLEEKICKVSVLFVQKQKEKISHTGSDEFKIKVQQSNCLRGWLAFYIRSYASHVSRMMITVSQKKHIKEKKTQPCKTQGRTIINLPFKHFHHTSLTRLHLHM